MVHKKKLLAVAIAACVAGAAVAQVPDVLKSSSSKTATAAPAPAPQPPATGQVTKAAAPLPWESASQPKQPEPKVPDSKNAEAKPADASPASPKPMPTSAQTPHKTPAPVPSFEKPTEPIKEIRKAMAQEKPKAPIKGDSSWADRMARANEEAIVLKQEFENEELRKKITELRPPARQQLGTQGASAAQPIEPDPVVRAIEASRGRMTASVDFGMQSRVVTEGMQIGRWKVESIALNGVTMSDGRVKNVYPVRFPAATVAGQGQMQQFLTPPTASVVVPPPRIGGGAQPQMSSTVSQQTR